MSRKDTSLLFSSSFFPNKSKKGCNFLLKETRALSEGIGITRELRIFVVMLGTAEPEFIVPKSSRFVY